MQRPIEMTEQQAVIARWSIFVGGVIVTAVLLNWVLGLLGLGGL